MSIAHRYAPPRVNRDTDLPPVSFCVYAYNQEKYIGKTLASIAAQTYENLEIVVSDDCSTDSTLAEILKWASTYQGNRNVLVRKGDTNLGTMAHLNEMLALAGGRLFVLGGGDDINFPDRVERLVRVYESIPGRKPSIVFSNGYRLGADGEFSTQLVISGLEEGYCDNSDVAYGGAPFCGAFFMVERGLYEHFKSVEIKDKILAEDVVLARRAKLLHGLYFVNEPLVHYRIHSGSGSGAGVSGSRWIRDRIFRWHQLLLDLDTAAVPEETRTLIRRQCHREIRKMTLDLESIDSNLRTWIKCFSKMLFLSPREAGYMAKKRVKRIVKGQI